MVHTDKVLDAKGLACPMPIVKTKKMMKEMDPGEVLEVQATDKGSTADLQAWAKSSGHEYIGTETDGDVLIHYLRKEGASETQEAIEIPEVGLADFQARVESGEALAILDVREQEEYEEAHIPGVKHIPLGEVEHRMAEIDPQQEIYIICHSGRRSGVAGDMMAKKGFKTLFNVVPGMRDWTGKTEQSD